MKSQKRNLNPTPAAVAAMYVYCKEYGDQGGGSMDFWDGLDQRRKDFCNELVEKVLAAQHKHSR